MCYNCFSTQSKKEVKMEVVLWVIMAVIILTIEARILTSKEVATSGLKTGFVLLFAGMYPMAIGVGYHIAVLFWPGIVSVMTGLVLILIKTRLFKKLPI